MKTKILIQCVPVLCLIVFLNFRAWDMTYHEGLFDWINWASFFIIIVWYLLIEFGWSFVSSLFKRKG